MNAKVALLGQSNVNAVERMVKGFDYTAGFGGLALPAKRNERFIGDNIKVGLKCHRAVGRTPPLSRLHT